jgi:predicted nucleic acid-binding Zn ribbon protein
MSPCRSARVLGPNAQEIEAQSNRRRIRTRGSSWRKASKTVSCAALARHTSSRAMSQERPYVMIESSNLRATGLKNRENSGEG